MYVRAFQAFWKYIFKADLVLSKMGLNPLTQISCQLTHASIFTNIKKKEII